MQSKIEPLALLTRTKDPPHPYGHNVAKIVYYDVTLAFIILIGLALQSAGVVYSLACAGLTTPAGTSAIIAVIMHVLPLAECITGIVVMLVVDFHTTRIWYSMIIIHLAVLVEYVILISTAVIMDLGYNCPNKWQGISVAEVRVLLMVPSGLVLVWTIFAMPNRIASRTYQQCKLEALARIELSTQTSSNLKRRSSSTGGETWNSTGTDWGSTQVDYRCVECKAEMDKRLGIECSTCRRVVHPTCARTFMATEDSCVACILNS